MEEYRGKSSNKSHLSICQFLFLLSAEEAFPGLHKEKPLHVGIS